MTDWQTAQFAVGDLLRESFVLDSKELFDTSKNSWFIPLHFVNIEIFCAALKQQIYSQIVD